MRPLSIGKRALLIAAGVLWAAAVGFGMRTLVLYESTPGTLADAGQSWPGGSTLPRKSGLPTLVVLAHPQCVCTRASLSELNVVMQRFHGRLTAYVLYVQPHDMPENWGKSDSWRTARNIPGVVVMVDRDGVEAKQFHGYTSGQTLVYDADGRLLYNGGLTAARGHEGDNSGRRAVIALLNGEARGPLVHSVFGCLLFSADENARLGIGEGS
jgi:hypothetical protein